jgi:hypothetical protein
MARKVAVVRSRIVAASSVTLTGQRDALMEPRFGPTMPQSITPRRERTVCGRAGSMIDVVDARTIRHEVVPEPVSLINLGYLLGNL